MHESAPIVEEKELTIDSIEGLQEFLLYAKEALAELELSAKTCTSAELCRPFVEEGKKSLSELESLVAQYTRILDLGGYIADENIESMQDVYNNLLKLQDDLVAAMEFVPSVEPLPEKHIYGERENAGTTRRMNAAMVVQDESPTVETSSLPIRENDFNSEEVRTNLKALKRRGEGVVADAKTLLHEFAPIKEVIEEDGYEGGVVLYTKCESELGALQSQLAKLEEIFVAPVSSFTVNFLEETEGRISDFAKVIAEAKTTLPEYFADEEEEVESIVRSESLRPLHSEEKSFKPSLFAKNELRPFIEGALSVSGNSEFLASYFSSPGAFEAYLKRDIDEREKPSKFEKVFGIKYQSAFHNLLRDLTLAEVEHLEQMPSADVRAILLELDIQYEIYVAWMNAYDVMKDYVRPLPSTTFGEFYVRAMIEDLKTK